MLGTCRAAKDTLKRMAADIWEANGGRPDPGTDGVISEGRHMTWSDVIGKYFGDPPTWK